MQEGSLELCLTYCGWESCNPAHRFGPNQRASSVLHVIQKGKGTLEINKKVYLEIGATLVTTPEGTTNCKLWGCVQRTA